MVSPGVAHLSTDSPRTAAETAGADAGKDAEYDPDGKDRHDAEQDQQRRLDHETLPSVSASPTGTRGKSTASAAIGIACEKRHLAAGDRRGLVAGRIGRSARGHPVLSIAGHTDIYPCKGGHREEGPDITTGNVSGFSIRDIWNRARVDG